MNHDISHCSNEDCEVRDKCYRYFMHLETVKMKLDYITYTKCENKEFFQPYKLR